jgi:hypothetical protein
MANPVMTAGHSMLVTLFAIFAGINATSARPRSTSAVSKREHLQRIRLRDSSYARCAGKHKKSFHLPFRISWTQEYSAHGALYGTLTNAVQRFLEGLPHLRVAFQSSPHSGSTSKSSSDSHCSCGQSPQASPRRSHDAGSRKVPMLRTRSEPREPRF